MKLEVVNKSPLMTSLSIHVHTVQWPERVKRIKSEQHQLHFLGPKWLVCWKWRFHSWESIRDLTEKERILWGPIKSSLNSKPVVASRAHTLNVLPNRSSFHCIPRRNAGGAGRRKGESPPGVCSTQDSPGWTASKDDLAWHRRSSNPKEWTRQVSCFLNFSEWRKRSILSIGDRTPIFTTFVGRIHRRTWLTEEPRIPYAPVGSACSLLASRAGFITLPSPHPFLPCLSPQGSFFPGLLSHSCSWKVSIERMFWSSCRAKTDSHSPKSFSFFLDIGWVRFPWSPETELWPAE